MKIAKGIRGNMTADPNKEITSIAYNHLNLPTTITFTNSRSISFMYDAGGNKLRKTVAQSGVTQYIQDYVGGIEYRTTPSVSSTPILESIFHAEGRITNVNSTLKYEYAMKDHLGNTRLMFCDKNGDGKVSASSTQENSEITQENHFYPFGLNMEGTWCNTPSVLDSKYGYNAKEFNDDFGLNWNDYGARFYDAAIAKWSSFDPKAEKMRDYSPYNYVLNNPMRLIDPDGKAPTDHILVNDAHQVVGIIRDGNTTDRIYQVKSVQGGHTVQLVGTFNKLPALAANNAIPKQKIVNAVLSGSMNSNGRGNVTNPSIQNVAPNGQAAGAAPIAGNGGGGNVGAGGVNGQNTIAVIGSGGGAANPTTIFTPNSNAPAADNRFDITTSTSNNTVNTLNSLNTGQNPQQLNNTQLSFNQGLSVPAPTTTSPEEDSRRSGTGAGQLSANDRQLTTGTPGAGAGGTVINKKE